MSKVYVIHENSVWVEPLRSAFDELETPFEEWFLDQGVLDLRSPPPQGVFYNRMSASSHTRDHRYAAEYTGAVLAWLERHGRTIVNDSRGCVLRSARLRNTRRWRASAFQHRKRWPWLAVRTLYRLLEPLGTR